ncbi:hypothetical protein [Streptosporangium subroseum]|uniref:hypothetical protein n=1 Tax=Streptosporangium subroseum TaxID=106412 RepID=UPI003092AA8C|nr:hypothetical protein OHB15_19910 [Streptosporangium subroseum]
MRWPAATLVLILVAGCAASPPRASTAGASETPLPSKSATTTDPVAVSDRSACASPSASPETTALPEVRGAARDAELWGLLFAPLPFPTGKTVKIVWRMTGSGPLRVSATHPDGTRATFAFGPEEHGGSNWKRPGDEWGTGLVFPKAGCWKVRLSRDTGTGEVWLPVR